MSVRDLYLDPDCIFLGPGGDEVLLCYIPHVSDTEPDSVRLLSEFFLKKLDHSDQTAVSLVYPLYDQVSSDSYDLTEILSRLLQSGQRGEDAAAPAKDNPPKAAQETVRSGIPEREEFSDSNVRRLPPPDTRRRRVKSTSGHSRRKAAGQRTAAARKKQRRNLSGALPGPLLPAAVILPAAVVLIVVFQMDLTQMMGMGFLCAALIWIIHSSLEKHASEGRNIWFDEEEASQSDELFYQSLREELYAEDARFGKSAVKDPAAARSGAYDRPTGSGASAHPIGSGGYGGYCGDITINGGNIMATGGDCAAGIGSGRESGSCGTITIKSTVTSVTATKGDGSPNSIGAGQDSPAITVNIEAGANVTQN